MDEETDHTRLLLFINMDLFASAVFHKEPVPFDVAEVVHKLKAAQKCYKCYLLYNVDLAKLWNWSKFLSIRYYNSFPLDISHGVTLFQTAIMIVIIVRLIRGSANRLRELAGSPFSIYWESCVAHVGLANISQARCWIMKKRTLIDRDCNSVNNGKMRGANAIPSDSWRAVIRYYVFIKGIAVIRRIPAKMRYPREQHPRTLKERYRLHTSYRHVGSRSLLLQIHRPASELGWINISSMLTRACSSESASMHLRCRAMNNRSEEKRKIRENERERGGEIFDKSLHFVFQHQGFACRAFSRTMDKSGKLPRRERRETRAKVIILQALAFSLSFSFSIHLSL